MTFVYGVGTVYSMNFFKRLFMPPVEDRIPKPAKRSHMPVTSQAILLAVAADWVSGPETTNADLAAFVAYPFILNEIANRGAQKGYGESMN